MRFLCLVDAPRVELGCRTIFKYSSFTYLGRVFLWISPNPHDNFLSKSMFFSHRQLVLFFAVYLNFTNIISVRRELLIKLLAQIAREFNNSFCCYCFDRRFTRPTIILDMLIILILSSRYQFDPSKLFISLWTNCSNNFDTS